uniref:Immunoglobulin domain-containing protein n=1 Tax=Sphaeramia orbicularis TaxID=375764 RepID=A0A673ADZ5_9TELE
MKICHSLIFFFLSEYSQIKLLDSSIDQTLLNWLCNYSLCIYLTALQDGNIGLISAKIPVFKKTEGETIILKCPFEWSLFDTGKKIFCRNEYVLFETSNMSGQKGRYSIELMERSSDTVMSVTITHLKESDSGLYRCVSERYGQDEYTEFWIIVTKGEFFPKVFLFFFVDAQTDHFTSDFSFSYD